MKVATESFVRGHATYPNPEFVPENVFQMLLDS